MITRRPTTPHVPAREPIASPTPPLDPDVPIGVDPVMITSLPPMMSGADIYIRQFYRGHPLPFRRYLPLKGL